MVNNRKKPRSELDEAIEQFASGHFDDAEPLFVSALGQVQQDREAHFYYGQLLCERNRFPLAESHFRFCMTQDPVNPDYIASVAYAIHKQGRVGDAQGFYSQALETDPDNALALRNLGILRLDQGRSTESLELLQRSVDIRPDDAKAQNCVGIALQDNNRLFDAEKAFRKAVSLWPTYASAHTNLVSVLERLNQLPEAQQALEDGKASCPQSNLFDLYEAILLKRHGKFADAVAILERETYPQDTKTVAKAQCELGRLYDRMGEFDKAFAQFDKFNAYATQAFGITPAAKAAYLDEVETCRKVFTKEFVGKWTVVNSDYHRSDPCFLFGFARSGTTLMQHVLGSHPEIHATEEVPAFPKVVEHIEQEIGDYPTCIALLEQQTVSDLRQLYFSIQQQELEWKDHEILVDKYPLMTPMVGAIHRLFPDAKMLFALRHPYDCILSSYMHLFVPNDSTIHFYNLGDTVNIYCKLMDLWAHYQKVLSLRIHTVRYEDVVSDFRPTVGEILDFLGVSWDDAVLKYHERAAKHANIRTPSYDQVSQKIYGHACYRWERYRPYLEPYLDRLAPYAERFGYEL